MGFWAKKEKPSENVAFASIFGALNAICALLIAFFPLLSVPLAILLPLLSAFVGYLCKWKYALAYAIGASLLSLAVSSFNIFEALLSVVPPILVGTLFGFLRSKRIGGGFAVFFVSLLQFALNFGVAKLLEITISINPIDLFFDLFRIERTERTLSFVPAFVMALSFLQTAISNFFVTVFAYRLPDKETEGHQRNHTFPSFLVPCLGILFSSLTLGVGYVSLSWGSLLLCFSFYFGILSITSFRDEKRWWIYVLLLLCFLGVFFLRAALSSRYEEGILLYCLFTLPLDFLALVSNLLKRKDKDEVS